MTRLSLYSPASRHHQLHLNSVGHQDPEHLLVGPLLHSAIGRRGVGSGIQGSHSISCEAMARQARGIPPSRTLCQSRGALMCAASSHLLLFVWYLLTVWACVAV